MPSEKPCGLGQEYMLSLIRGGAQLLSIANARIHRLEERVERVEGELFCARAEVCRGAISDRWRQSPVSGCACTQKMNLLCRVLS